MKKILVTLLFAASLIPAVSDAHGWRGGHYGGYHGGGYGWVAPLIIGGAIVYGATRYYPPPQTIIVTPQPTYHYEEMYDQSCSCTRRVLVQNQ